MDLAYRLLTPDELDNGLRELRGWAVEGGMLTKTFTFDCYQKGLVFASTVGYVADSLDHHPDLSILYQRVVVAMSTHSVNGLSPYDLELARRIDALTL